MKTLNQHLLDNTVEDAINEPIERLRLANWTWFFIWVITIVLFSGFVIKQHGVIEKLEQKINLKK
jgi:hypothetical protein